MSTSLYRDSQMEQELRGKIDAAANERHGGAVPADVQERITTEKQHIFGSGHGTSWPSPPSWRSFPKTGAAPWGSGGSPATCTCRTFWASPPSIPWSWGSTGRAAWAWMGRVHRNLP